MFDLKLNPQEDIVFNGHDFELVSGVDQVAQSLLIHLKTFYGEWFLDTSIGVDYFGKILVKNPNIDLIKSLLKVEIMKTPQIKSITSFNLDFDAKTRQCTVSFSCNTTIGIVSVQNASLTTGV